MSVNLMSFIGLLVKRGHRKHVKTCITMISRKLRQIVGFDVVFDKSPERIQKIVDNSPTADFYYTDGYRGYVDVVYQGKHIRNPHNKNDTHNVESVNADLCHYIPILARKSRCFARKLETLYSVISVFVEAYNKFGLTKYRYRHFQKNAELPFSIVDFL